MGGFGQNILREANEEIQDASTGLNLVVINSNNGEQWEDYDHWVEKIYSINSKKTGKELSKEWREHVCEILLQSEIEVNPHYIETVMITSKVKDKKKVKKIIKENAFEPWLVKNYNAREMKFSVVDYLPRCLNKK